MLDVKADAPEYASLFGCPLPPIPTLPSPQVDASATALLGPLTTKWTRPTSKKLKPPSLLSFYDRHSSLSSAFSPFPPLCFHPSQPCGHRFDLYFPFYALRATIAGELCRVNFKLRPFITTPWPHFFRSAEWLRVNGTRSTAPCTVPDFRQFHIELKKYTTATFPWFRPGRSVADLQPPPTSPNACLGYRWGPEFQDRDNRTTVCAIRPVAINLSHCAVERPITTPSRWLFCLNRRKINRETGSLRRQGICIHLKVPHPQGPLLQ